VEQVGIGQNLFELGVPSRLVLQMIDWVRQTHSAREVRVRKYDNRRFSWRTAKGASSTRRTDEPRTAMRFRLSKKCKSLHFSVAKLPGAIDLWRTVGEQKDGSTRGSAGLAVVGLFPRYICRQSQTLHPIGP
jgi:hypothetical protein